MPKIISNTIQFHVAKYDNVNNFYKHLLLKRSPRNKIYPNVWQVITGTIELGETAIETALREITEETGLVVTQGWNIPYISQYYDINKDAIGLAPCFGTIVNNSLQIKLSEEHTEYKWCTLEEARNLLPLPSHKSALDVFHKDILEGQLGKLYEFDIEKIK